MKKARFLLVIVLAFILSVSIGTTSAFAGQVAYPNLSTDNSLVEIGNGEITELEASEIAGAFPYCYAGTQDVGTTTAWMDYVLHELTTAEYNPIGAQNERAWVTRGNNANSTSWLRHFFNGVKKIKQVVLLAPDLKKVPDAIDFIYSNNATANTPVLAQAANTDPSYEWQWNKTINGAWAHVGAFTETEWTQATTNNTRDDDYTWNGYKKVITFAKPISATAITTLLTKNTQEVRLNYIRFYQDAEATEVANDKAYTYNYDYTATVSDQLATSDSVGADTGAQMLNDGITGDLFAKVAARYGRWHSQNGVAGGHTVEFVRNSELNVGGIALHVGSNKSFFPSNFTIESKAEGESEWMTVASYRNYTPTDAGWQYFMFVTPAIGDIRINIADERYVEIAEAVMLETTEMPRTVSSIELVENSFPANVNYGTDLDLTNAKLSVTYSDNATEQVAITADMISGYNKNQVGEQTVNVTYGVKTTTFSITVTDVMQSIKANISKDTYKIGETLDLTNATVGILYASGTTDSAELTATMVTGFDSTTAGVKTLTISYEGLTCTKEITVEDYVTAISATISKTSYTVGDTLDLAGAKLALTYASGATDEIDITTAMVTGFDSATAGTKTLTVTYEGLTDTVEITVAEAQNQTPDEPIDETDKKGCGSSIAATSAIFGAVCAFAAVAFARKKD